MPTTETAIDHPLYPAEHPERHEHTDLQVSPLVLVFITGALVVALVLVGVYFLFFAFGEIDKRLIDQPKMSAINAPRIEPNEPRIQGIPGFHTNVPWQDTQEMKRATADILNSTGPTGENGYVHIPISQAMHEIVQDGSLKVREHPNVPNQGGADNAP